MFKKRTENHISMYDYILQQEKKFKQFGIVGITPSMSFDFDYEPTLLANQEYDNVLSDHHTLYQGWGYKSLCSYKQIIDRYKTVAIDLLNTFGVKNKGVYIISVWNNVRLYGLQYPTVITLRRKS